MHYGGKLHPSRYLAVIEVAIRLKEYDYAFHFIETYKNDIINENESQDIYKYNLASYMFVVGRFQDCLDLIPPVSPFVDYLVIGKRLELKALYELRSEQLGYKLDAFKMFLSRTSTKLLPDSLREANTNFANMLTQLVASRPGDKARAALLVKRFGVKKKALEWKWLLDKANELNKPL
jgi:hypothetical protein